MGILSASTRRRQWLTAVLAAFAGIALLTIVRQRPPEPPNPASLVKEVQKLNQLTTVRYTVQRIVDLEEQKQPVGAERILLVLQARVEAGVNLGALEERDVQRRADGAVIVRLPPAEITNAAVDEGQTKVWDRTKTWWTPWVPYSRDLEQKARQKGLEAAKTAALEMGILRQAEANAEAAIRTLLSLSGAERVVVIRGSAS